ncbi:TPA: hypothetical protein ACHVJA_001692 [Streptococcus suis]|nr:hypothetical protein [Streptococcus suis]MCK3980691.1 hypothetical protein [Streptococcus suis]MCK4014289.1 hypothetical protein [Streptococcus suis]MCK4036763.1 hypothetical protein [Streptococcus suis]MCK4059497.1 hypothetical protein [Streptococcus suis]
MGRQVKDVINQHEPQAFAVTFAIHQSRSECVASFSKLRETEEVNFTGWNDDVKNKTGCKTEDDLLNSYVDKVHKVTNDWCVIEILPF